VEIVSWEGKTSLVGQASRLMYAVERYDLIFISGESVRRSSRFEQRKSRTNKQKVKVISFAGRFSRTRHAQVGHRQHHLSRRIRRGALLVSVPVSTLTREFHHAKDTFVEQWKQHHAIILPTDAVRRSSKE
jgi:hypothetical protein